jgi:hypothetical protein
MGFDEKGIRFENSRCFDALHQPRIPSLRDVVCHTGHVYRRQSRLWSRFRLFRNPTILDTGLCYWKCIDLRRKNRDACEVDSLLLFRIAPYHGNLYICLPRKVQPIRATGKKAVTQEDPHASVPSHGVGSFSVRGSGISETLYNAL